MPEAEFLQDLYYFALAKYCWAARYAPGRIVLEAGCGAGYGAAEIAKKAKKVYAIDINSETIKRCQKTYSQDKKIIFKIGDVTKLDFPSNFFDLVIAFELIEHIPDYNQAVEEFYRVLKPKGLLILSTPNKDVYSPGTKKPFYPFHIKEFTLEELKILLKKFQNIEIFGQFIDGKKMLDYKPWQIKRLIRILFANLPFSIKKLIMRIYLRVFDLAYKSKIYRPAKVNQKDIYFSKHFQSTREFVILAQKI